MKKYCLLIAIIVHCVVVLMPMAVSADGVVNSYTNQEWGFVVDVPRGWIITDTNQLIAEIKKDPASTPELLTGVKESGLVVNISAHPLGSEKEVNPNVSIAAKPVKVNPKPVEENDWVQFAGDILANVVPDPMTLSAPTQMKVGNLVGLVSGFTLPVPEKGIVKAKIYVLIDQQQWKYYIVTATFNEEKAVEDQVMAVAASFRQTQ